MSTEMRSEKEITKSSIVDIYSNIYTDLVRSFLAWQPLRKHAREDNFASRHPTGWLSKREKDLYWTLYNTLHNWLQVYYMCCKLLPVCSLCLDDLCCQREGKIWNKKLKTTWTKITSGIAAGEFSISSRKFGRMSITCRCFTMIKDTRMHQGI